MSDHTFFCTVHAYNTQDCDSMLGGIGYNNTMDIRTLFKQDSRMLKDYLSFKLGCLK